MPQEKDSYHLWLACRRLENSYRFTSDVLLALMKQLEANMPKVRFAGRGAPDLTIDPWPKPPCFPGQPCAKTIGELQEFNELLTEHAVTVRRRLEDLYDLAKDLGIKNLVFTPSQLPVLPEGSNGGNAGGHGGNLPAKAAKPRAKVEKPRAKVGRPKRELLGTGGRK